MRLWFEVEKLASVCYDVYMNTYAPVPLDNQWLGWIVKGSAVSNKVNTVLSYASTAIQKSTHPLRVAYLSSTTRGTEEMMKGTFSRLVGGATPSDVSLTTATWGGHTITRANVGSAGSYIDLLSAASGQFLRGTKYDLLVGDDPQRWPSKGPLLENILVSAEKIVLACPPGAAVTGFLGDIDRLQREDPISWRLTNLDALFYNKFF